MRLRSFVMVSCLACLGAFDRPDASADEAFATGCSQLAARVERLIDDRGGRREIVVGGFAAPPRLRTPGGLALSREVARAFEKKSFKIDPKAPFQLRGEFTIAAERRHADDTFDTATVKVTASLLDSQDQKIADLSINVVGDSVATLTGATVMLRADEPEANRQARLLQSLGLVEADSREICEPVVDEGLIRAADDSPYGVSLHALRAGAAIDPRQLDVRLFDVCRATTRSGWGELVRPIPRGTPYVIRLVNRSDRDAAAMVSVDTLGVFTFSDDDAKDAAILVRAKSETYVKGWYRNRTTSNLFEVARYSESAGGFLLAPESQCGVVTVLFAAAWPANEPPPADEKAFARPKGDGTKLGEEVQLTYTPVLRHVGKTRAVVSVRYAQP